MNHSPDLAPAPAATGGVARGAASRVFRRRRLTAILGALLLTGGATLMTASPAAAATQLRYTDASALIAGSTKGPVCDVGGDTPADNDRCVSGNAYAVQSGGTTTAYIFIAEGIYVAGALDTAASRIYEATGQGALKLESLHSATFTGTMDVTVSDFYGTTISEGPQEVSQSMTGVGPTQRTRGQTIITGPDASSIQIYNGSQVFRHATGQFTLGGLTVPVVGQINTMRQATVEVILN